MPIDVDVARGAFLPELNVSWTATDVILYHLGIGAGMRPGDNTNAEVLRYTNDYPDESNLVVLPSFGIQVTMLGDTKPPSVAWPGCDINLANILHGSEAIRLNGPIPVTGNAKITCEMKEIYDKGKAAVIVQEAVATAEDGTVLWTTERSIFVRGEGGWGGDRGPSTAIELPTREPDAVASYETTPNQAMLYRLSGDRNPLHSDPGFAAGAGFPAPILHGLCSWGVVLREVTDALLGSNVAAVTGYGARFAGVVFPGETIQIKIWDERGNDAAGNRILVSATLSAPGTERDGSPVLADCWVTTAS